MRINPPSVPNNQHHWLRHIPLRLAGESEMENAEDENFVGRKGSGCFGEDAKEEEESPSRQRKSRLISRVFCRVYPGDNPLSSARSCWPTIKLRPESGDKLRKRQRSVFFAQCGLNS